MYYQKGDEVEVVDDFKLDGVLKGDRGFYRQHIDSNDISQSVCKITLGDSEAFGRVVYIPEVSIKHAYPEIAKERLAAIGKQAEIFAKSKGIELPDSKSQESETTAKPTRYNTGDIELWDAIDLLGLDYMQGNVIKYTARYRHKNGSQDLFKALNYLVKIMSRELDLDFYDLRTKTVEELSVICDKKEGNETKGNKAEKIS